MKGLNIGTLYWNAPQSHEFAAAIAEVQRIEIKNHLIKCTVAAVIDRSTESSITENEMVYIQSCKDGVVKTNFVYCCQVQQGTAMDVVHAMQRTMNTVIDLPDFIRKLFALGSDEAAVMLAKNSGVISLLQAGQLSMITVHCSCHRLEFVYKDGIKKFPIAEKVVTLLSGLFYMCRNSTLNRTNLKNAYKCLGHKILVPTRAGGTR